MEAHLIDTPGGKREAEACRRLPKIPISKGIFEPLGLCPDFSWYIFGILENRLVDSFDGEIDILAGRLAWNDPGEFEALVAEHQRSHPDWNPSYHFQFAALKLASSGGITWPPPVDYLIAIEAKCAYFDPDARKVKSQKSSPKKLMKIQDQITKLLRMGFNRVALLDFIANPPGSATDIQAWFTASDTAWDSEKQMLPILNRRLPGNSPAGHFVLSLASVIGGNETLRGGGYPTELRKPIDNPQLRDPQTQNWRNGMERKLHSVLESKPRPRSFPAMF